MCEKLKSLLCMNMTGLGGMSQKDSLKVRTVEIKEATCMSGYIQQSFCENINIRIIKIPLMVKSATLRPCN